MRRTAQEILEFEELLALLRQRSTCAPGRRAIDALEFREDRAALQAEFVLIREAREWLRPGRELGFGALSDPAGWLERIEGPGLALEARELLDAASMLETAGWLKEQFREDRAEFPLLAARASELADFRDLLAVIRRAILPDGQISDDASPTLRRIRQNIVQSRDSIQKSLKQILRSRNAEAGEDYVTLRNDRFVIPVRAEHRRSVPGVVHGASGTGQTIFLEPLETVESNNQLVQLSEEEAAEILRILHALTERLRETRGPLRHALKTIAELDSVFARARFARDFDAALPELSESNSLHLVAARHPVLEARLKSAGRTVVPMTLSLDGEERVLVISGPNTGGKTVALKTAGLAALAAQSGIPVAAQSAKLPLFDHVLVDIGDEQSIAADLSTFSAHMLNLRSMLDAATPRSLVLADEMGTGTAPEEGAALSVALLDAFREKQCLVLATTHHDRLKTYASSTPGVVNAAVEFDDVHLRPTYRLMVGVPGGSSGIAIAERLGMEDAIIQRARALLAPESREAADLIAYLHRSRDEIDRMRQQVAGERRALEAERESLRRQWVARQQQRIRELEKQFEEMQKRFEENVARTIEAIRGRELRGSAEKAARRKMQQVRGDAREELNAAVVQTISASQEDLGSSHAAAAPVSSEQLQPGARIHVRGFSRPAVLRRVEGNSAEVEAGPLRMKIALDEITGVEAEAAAAAAAPARGGITVRAQTGGGSASDEINVIGLTVEEATARIDKFLDEAALAKKPRVRIVHGHGTGALRKGIGAFLGTHPLVRKYGFDAEERGGKAVTVAELQA
jgi:DNA mismatch repair protein MutS2